MHRSDFCLAGTFRDIFLFRSFFKIRILLLLIISSMTLFEAARVIGCLPLYPFPLVGPPSLTTPLGGLLFGIGMVLAGGCVVGSLYKMGTGSAPSLVAVIGLVTGSALYAEIFPWWNSVAATANIVTGKITLAQLLGTPPHIPIVTAILIALPCIIMVQRHGAWVRPLYTEGSLQPWLAALLLSLLGVTSYILIGMPLGITTAYAKCAAYLEAEFLGNHIESMAFFKAVPLKYVHPLTGTQLAGGPGPQFDAIAMIQFPLIFGIITGGAVSARLLKEFKLHWRLPVRQYLSAAAGGILMGLASRMAAGCNVWHLLGGLPILALQSMLFLIGLVPGAWVGSLLLSRYVIR